MFTVEEYYKSLETEYERQQVNVDYNRWSIYSGTLNRQLRQLMKSLESDRKKYAIATVAFRLWQEYNAELRGDKLDDKWAERVFEYVGVLNGTIDITQVTGPLS